MWDYYAMKRAEQGLRAPSFCANRGSIVTRLLAADNSADCRPTTSRRKRSANGLCYHPRQTHAILSDKA